jgi:hypothetical protein
MSKVAIVGTISNVENVLSRDLEKITSALKNFNVTDIYLVESDSCDQTSLLLEELEKKYSCLKHTNLGNLKDNIPNRIDRIRHCRNHYVKWIRENYIVNLWDYVVVVDLDGMNKKIELPGISSCFLSDNNWDAVFANQKYGYYDIYALRHKVWMPYDCFRVLNIMKKKLELKLLKKPIQSFLLKRIYFDLLRKKLVYDKMLKIPINSDWIQVNSGFGGLAIYKTKLFLTNDYSVINGQGRIRSEHIDFHEKCINDGYALFINPKLINSNWNEYNVNKIFLIRQARMVFYELRDFYFSLKSLMKTL